MNKRILLIILILVSILVTGCGNNQAKSVPTSELTNNKSSDTSIITNQENSENNSADNYSKWNGIWKLDSKGELGLHNSINIESTDEKYINFKFNASYVYQVNGDLNANIGNIEGIAYFTSSNEACYKSKDFPDYELVFVINDNNTLTIKELNIKTKNDYGITPFGGHNVEFSGEYVLDNAKEIEYSENLCAYNEDVLLSFKIANSSKVLSVCISKSQPDYIVYRFGTKNKIEFEYPSNKDNSWSEFTYSYNLSEGGLDLNYLTFINDGFQYKIYQEHNAKDHVTEVGIKIKDNTTNKETNIKGVGNDIVGSLINLRYNYKIKMDNSME